MREACLDGMDDKRLQSLNAKFRVRLPQHERIRQRMVSTLEQQLKRMFTRQRASAAIGRDAVMQRLWNNVPLLLLRAGDAGDALVRQVDDGLAKRTRAGMSSELTNVPSRQWLGEMCGRDDVAVVAMAASGMAAATVNRLNVYCLWLERMKHSMTGRER